jgi:hypothetical protein
MNRTSYLSSLDMLKLPSPSPHHFSFAFILVEDNFIKYMIILKVLKPITTCLLWSEGLLSFQRIVAYMIARDSLAT